jgi:hypothetical protein
MKDEIFTYTLRVICHTAFGLELKGEFAEYFLGNTTQMIYFLNEVEFDCRQAVSNRHIRNIQVHARNGHISASFLGLETHPWVV